MTEKQLKQVESQLPEGQTLNRVYRAFEGDIRVISRDAQGREYRYTVVFGTDDNVTIKEM